MVCRRLFSTQKWAKRYNHICQRKANHICLPYPQRNANYICLPCPQRSTNHTTLSWLTIAAQGFVVSAKKNTSNLFAERLIALTAKRHTLDLFVDMQPLFTPNPICLPKPKQKVTNIAISLREINTFLLFEPSALSALPSSHQFSSLIPNTKRIFNDLQRCATSWPKAQGSKV